MTHEKEISLVNQIKFETDADRINHLQSLMNIPSINPKDYSPSGEFYRLDFIKHPSFGLGFVEVVLSNQEIKVFFTEGSKVLEQKSYLKETAI